MNILAIIPARAGSKGLSCKNSRKLNGLPLISHTINQAKKSKMINKIIVSTDDPKIVKISKQNKIDVPFIRPKKLSKDDTPIKDVIQHVLKSLKDFESYVPDIVIILQPTSPFRTVTTIDKSIKLLIKSNSDSVLSVYLAKNNYDISFNLKNNLLIPNNKEFQKFSLRQIRQQYYLPSGTVYVFWSSTLQKYNSIYGKKISPLIIQNDAELTDIDYLFDLFVAEMISKNWKNFQNKNRI